LKETVARLETELEAGKDDLTTVRSDLASLQALHAQQNCGEVEQLQANVADLEREKVGTNGSQA
jgi:archaellum component FlaC